MEKIKEKNVKSLKTALEDALERINTEHVDEISDIEKKFSDVNVIEDCIKRIDEEINVTCEDASTATILRRGGNVNYLTEATSSYCRCR